MDPSPWLSNGWTRLELNQRPIVETSQLSQGDLVIARIKDGILELRIEDITQKASPYHQD
jgi:hypothetical protein